MNAAQAQADGGTAKDCLLRHFGRLTFLDFACFAPVKSPAQGLTAWRSNWASEFPSKKLKIEGDDIEIIKILATVWAFFDILHLPDMEKVCFKCVCLYFFLLTLSFFFLPETWGFPTSLIYAHIFSSIFPLILIAALALFKGPKLSLVLGVNVFLPGFTAAFGKYLIAFRCKPESERGNLLTPFLPEFPGALILTNLISIAILRVEKLLWHDLARYVFGRRNESSTWTQALSLSWLYDLALAGAAVVIPFAIVLCFVLGALGWLLAVRREAKAVPGCYERKFWLFTKLRVTERSATALVSANLICKFLFSLWLYNSFSHLYDLFLLNQLTRVLLVQVKGVCCAFLVEMQPTWITELSFVEHQQVPESGKEPEMPSYILFLTGSYKSECRAWEIERLVRKMLLSLLTATIPVSYSPALQMLVVSGILIVSMGLHHYFMPYKVSWTVPLIECPIPPVLPFGFKPATIAFTARIEQFV